MTENTLHTEQFTIRANEVDTFGKLSLGAICNYFQEVAGNNADALNFGIDFMREKKLTWVLQRMDINLHKSANWKDVVTVETWPASGDSFRAYRNYRIIDANNKEIGNCLSYWLALSLETRKPTRIPQEVLDTRLDDRPHVSEVKSNRIHPFKETGSDKEIVVRRADLDMNNHVNNVRYIEWMMETIDQESAQKLRNFEIHFLRETFVDDHLISSSLIENELIKFKISNSEGKMIALAEGHF
ncbi:MAG: acyl-[acyl-carrier-protein] thioesterase [Balneolaceae bacterium]